MPRNRPEQELGLPFCRFEFLNNLPISDNLMVIVVKLMTTIDADEDFIVVIPVVMMGHMVIMMIMMEMIMVMMGVIIVVHGDDGGNEGDDGGVKITHVIMMFLTFLLHSRRRIKQQSMQ